jgi:hypothetical protein
MPGSNADPSKDAIALLRMVFGFPVSQALYVAADLGIADYLAGGALCADDLADKSGSHPDALARLLRALVAFGIVSQEENRFALTSVGQLLRSDVAGSLRATIRFLVGPWNWRAWENLPHSIRTAQPAFDHAWGMSNFDYWERHPDVSKIHDEAMEGLTAMESLPILAAFNFSSFRAVVDVGGGNGALLAAALRPHPRLTGKLFDLPHVVSLASTVLQRAGVANRCEIISGNFFESVPERGDLYVLKSIIHDWDDGRALMILQNCHRAMEPSATLLLLERVLPDQPDMGAAPRYLADLGMLIITPGGRERTQEEYKKLLESAGFEFVRVIPTGGPLDIVEARKR